MNLNPHARVAPFHGEPSGSSSAAARHEQLSADARCAIERTHRWLLDQQHADGHWVAELEGDTILESEYILLLAFLGEHTGETACKAARHLLAAQLDQGGWTTYPGGPVDVSASVKAYFALKLTGHDPSSAPMQRARRAILARGGADVVNSFTRFYLALLGQIPYDQCPTVPPEAVLLPAWCPINLYRVSAWSRTIIVPLSIISACQPVVELDPGLHISELFLKPPAEWPPLRCPGQVQATGPLSWDRFFRLLDRTLGFFQRRGWTPLRRRALAKAEKWVVERFAGSEGLGAIFPPMIWSTIALKCLGYADDSPEVCYCRRHLDGLVIEENGAVRLQPCKSPVWDTAITLRALAVSGLERSSPAALRAVEWLLARETRCRGDWASTVRAEPGGWCFEYANEFYPDVDDTAMVMMALAGQVEPLATSAAVLPAELQLVDQTTRTSPNEARRHVALVDALAAASGRAMNWVSALQNRDGGWGAFDRDNDHEFLCHVPFADHNAMIDPSTPDLTGRVLEMLGQFGRRVGDRAVDRAVAYMRRSQQADGSWFGRWGVNYIYGTWQALAGLAAVGLKPHDEAIVRGANWLLAHQQPSGGWGESPDSYAHPHLRGQGSTTASQTAWAVMGLLAAGHGRTAAVARGIEYLVSRQRDDGTWHETEFTGTGFPQVFYLRYHYYPIYFPLLALAHWSAALGGEPADGMAPRAAFGGWASSRAALDG
jgi:squalene-hopene/tetraprenyl-beta-curcumene cyclase